MPGPASDMRGSTEAKKNIKGMIPPEMRDVCRSLSNTGKAENEAHAFRILVDKGFTALENGNSAAPTIVAEELAKLSPGTPKTITVTKSMHDRIVEFRRQNGDFVDGVAGALKHLVWIGMKS